MQPADSVLLFGGGLDSAAVFLHLVKTEVPFVVVHVNYGQVAAPAEIGSVVFWCRQYDIPFDLITDGGYIKDVNPQPSIMFGTGDSSPFIDARNLQLLLATARRMPQRNLVLGLTLEEGVMHTDANPDAVEVFDRVIRLSFPVAGKYVTAPLIGMPKFQAMREAYAFDPLFFEFTMTCWRPVQGSECGKCSHCLKKVDLQRRVHAS